MPVIDLFPPGGASLAIMLFFIIICGAADGACQGALFGEAAVLDGRYTQALIAGTAISGVAISSLRIITKALLPATSTGLRISADLYFILAGATCGFCIIIHSTILPRLRAEAVGSIFSSNRNLGNLGGTSSARLNVVYSDDLSNDISNDGTKSTIILGATGQQQGDDGGTSSSDSTRIGIENQTVQEEESEDFLLSSLPLPHHHPPPTYLEVANQVRTVAIALVFIYGITLSIFPGVLAEDVSSEKLGSWYPIILMFVFNLFDCAGKWLPILPSFQFHSAFGIFVAAVCRILFIPTFHLSATHGAGGVVMGLLSSLLGLTNGYLTASAMMLGPELVEQRAAALCGNIMVLSLIAGLNLGAACGFLWLLV